MLGAVMRTYSQPASTILMVCSTEPNVSIVSIVVIDWNPDGMITAHGQRYRCSPPRFPAIVIERGYCNTV